MADEARLIFELVDRSAGTTAPAPGAPSPGGPQPIGPSDPVGDAGQRNRPATPTPSGPAPVSPVAPESPRVNTPTIQPSAQPDSRWGDLVGSLTEIAKSLGLTATLQQTVAGQVLSFGMRAFNAVDRAADALQKFTGGSEQRPAAPGEQGGSRPMPVQPVSPTAVETVQPAAPVQPMPEAPRPVAPDPPERSRYDNGDVIEGTARPAMPDSGSRPALPAPTVPAQPSAGGGAMIPRPSLPAVAGQSAGVPAIPAAAGMIPSAAAGVPVTPIAAAGVPALAVAAPIAISAAAIYGAYKVGEATNTAAAQIAAGPVGGLSPDIARANAEQSVRELAANLLTAARIGDLIGDNVAAQGRMRAELQELRDTLLSATLGPTNRFTDVATGLLAVGNDLLGLISGGDFARGLGDGVFALFSAKFGGLIGWLEQYAKDADAEMRRKQMAESPIGAFEALPLPELPAPFAATDEMPLDQKFNPIPGLEL